jgi:hypothetical protein
VFSLDEICLLAESSPNRQLEVPLGLRTSLDYPEIISAGVHLRRRLEIKEWTFDVIDVLGTLKIKYIVDRDCETATNGDLIVLKHYPEDPETIFDAVHELSHWDFIRKGVEHTEGDAHLCALETVWPHAAWTSRHLYARLAVFDMLPRPVLAAWSIPWVRNCQSLLYLPGVGFHDPKIGRRLRKADMDRESRLRRLSELGQSHGDSEGSALHTSVQLQFLTK